MKLNKIEMPEGSRARAIDIYENMNMGGLSLSTLDLVAARVARRLDNIIGLYGEAREDNEIEFSIDVGMIISQLEIYDQIWFVRHMPKKGEHSREAKELVTEIIARLEDIPDGCAECFPFELIDELKQEYLTDNSL